MQESVRALIERAVSLLSSNSLCQSVVDDATKSIVEACKIIRGETTEGITFNTVADMKKADLKVGDIVITLGYDNIGDNGDSKYEIMDYDSWWSQLPNHLKVVTYHTDRIGCNPVFYKNPVDCYGNHILDNKLVAKLLIDNSVRVEQYGCIEGRKDNCQALIHLFGNVHTGNIVFGAGKTYQLYYTPYNQCYDRYEDIMGELPWWLSRERLGGNEYALINGCRCTHKPCLGNIKDVHLVGNGCTIFIPDNEFNRDGADFASFEFGGVVDGLEIEGFNFDPNGLNQLGYYTTKVTTNEDGTTTEEQVFNNMRTCNHTLSYFCSGVYNYNTEILEKTGLTEADIRFSESGKVATVSNVNIHHNNFYANGTTVNTSDGGGDHILFINPTVSENVFIEDNYFENWGRWVFAVDLGGNGERFYNYKFNRNKCIQTEENVESSNRSRGLGLIDFEARKCWTNLEVCDNYVYGANGWAFNGNGKISENITIKNNHIERPIYNWRSIYPYSYTFYSVYPKNLIFEDNEIIGGSVGLGKDIHNLSMRNNIFTNTGTITLSPTGNCIIENNTGDGTRNQLFYLYSTYSTWLTDPNSEWYIPEENRETIIKFINNGNGGVWGNLVKEDPTYYKNHTLIFENNHFNKFNVNCVGFKEYKFDISQLNSHITFGARGCTNHGETYSIGNYNPFPGGFHYKVGDLISNTTQNVTNTTYGIVKFYYEEAGMGLTVADIKNHDIYCAEEGTLPMNGEFLMAESDMWITLGTEVLNTGGYYCTRDNLYYCVNTGTLESIPSHTEGVAINGTATLMWLDKIAKIELRDKAN